jgi:hypothetical protein
MGTCYNKIEINTPIEKVWETINDFHDGSWAPGVVTSMDKVGDKTGNEIGAQRVINNAFHETLIEFNPEQYRFAYSIDDGPGPVAQDAVSDYVGVVQMTATDNGCEVVWSSSFKSENSDEVANFCNPIYQALLSVLKETLS